MKKRGVLITLAALITACGGSSPTLPVVTLYSYASSGGDLYKILLEGPGTDTRIGSINTDGAVTDIALNGSVLYGVSQRIGGDELIIIDTTTGNVQNVGATGTTGMNALTFDAKGNLYGATDAGVLYTLNPGTGAATRIGYVNYNVSGDLAFGPDGTLYVTLMGSSNDIFAKVNTSTGAATPIGLTGFNHVYGLTYQGSTMYGLTSAGQVIAVNLSTGAGTLRRSANLALTGAQKLHAAGIR